MRKSRIELARDPSNSFREASSLVLPSLNPTMITVASALHDHIIGRESGDVNQLDMKNHGSGLGTGYGTMGSEKLLIKESPLSSMHDSRSTMASNHIAISQTLHALEHEVQQGSNLSLTELPTQSNWHKSKAWRTRLRAWIQVSSKVQRQPDQQNGTGPEEGKAGASHITNATTTTATCSDIRLLVGSTAPSTSTVGLFGAPLELIVSPSPSPDLHTTGYCTTSIADGSNTPRSFYQLHHRQSSESSEDSFYFIAELTGNHPVDYSRSCHSRRISSEDEGLGGDEFPEDRVSSEDEGGGGRLYSQQVKKQQAFLSFLDIDD
ncbi:hypothetical protein BGW41_005730 [Actinomortierella wolfii]|nr:hypothetical protein BGW41_005730 [Actinomortierella wolfii]